MTVPPAPRHARRTHATWSGSGRTADQDVQAITVWTERHPGHGEDAEPLATHHGPSGHGLLAVFDGSGGSGAAPAWRGHTHAWTGARVARLAAECWFQRLVESGKAEDEDSGQLAYWLRKLLAAAPTSRPRSKLTGSMRRALPTTMAAIRYRVEDGVATWRALWAGDSRAYALLPGPGGGLRVLTRDDTVEDDALAQLRQDPPMTNVICADRPFTVNAAPAAPAGPHHAPLPCVLLAATDGFFGYVHTPAQFECLLLRTLTQSADTREWAERLRERVEPTTADDASLSLVAIGFAGFRELREAFADRCDAVLEEYRQVPLQAGQEALRRWQDETWSSYRPTYEELMPRPPEVHEQ